MYPYNASLGVSYVQPTYAPYAPVTASVVRPAPVQYSYVQPTQPVVQQVAAPQRILGESRVENVPYQRQVIEYEEEKRTVKVPKVKEVTDYYQVEYQKEYIPQYSYQKEVEYVPVEKYVPRVDYTEVERPVSRVQPVAYTQPVTYTQPVAYTQPVSYAPSVSYAAPVAPVSVSRVASYQPYYGYGYPSYGYPRFF